jgi:hypothetical protein
MFGHDDDQPNTDTAQMAPAQTIEPNADSSQAADAPDPAATPTDNPSTEAAQDDNPSDQSAAEPGTDPGANDTPPTDTAVPDIPPADQPVQDSDQPLMALPEPTPGAPELPDAPEGSEDLMAIKQEALQQLSPLVSHLDQSPEEKFHTTMMMIQASDDQSLVHTAFDAAKSITDDKTRAQALLDIINEINYFTQHQTTE